MNPANTEEEIRPFVQILRSMADMSIQGQERISIYDLSADGVATFSVPLDNLGLTADQVNNIYNFRCRTFINFLGELLVRPRFGVFFELLITFNNYVLEMCSGFEHQDFGLRLKRNPDIFEFSFHISLLNSLESKRQMLETRRNSDIEILPRKKTVK